MELAEIETKSSLEDVSSHSISAEETPKQETEELVPAPDQSPPPNIIYESSTHEVWITLGGTGDHYVLGHGFV